LEALYQAFPDAPFNIEIKGHRSGIEQAVFRQIEAAGAMERTLVVSDNRGTISRFRKVSQGKVATASSTVELLGYWLLHLLHLGGLFDPPFRLCSRRRNTRGSFPSLPAGSSAKLMIAACGWMFGRSTTNRRCDDC
jgi:hypothetical protein